MDNLHRMQDEGATRVPFHIGLAAGDLVPSLSSRIRASLWGIFIADALSAPAHWYYDTHALARDYGTITKYVQPLDHHATNGIMANHWRDNKHNVQGLVKG